MQKKSLIDLKPAPVLKPGSPPRSYLFTLTSTQFQKMAVCLQLEAENDVIMTNFVTPTAILHQKRSKTLLGTSKHGQL